MNTNPSFTGILENKGILTPEDSRRLLDKFKNDEWAILMYLTRGGATEAGEGVRALAGVYGTDGSRYGLRELGRLWGDYIGVAYIDLEKTLFQVGALQKMPVEFARDHLMIPLYELGEVVTVAASDPTNREVIQEAANIMGRRVSAVFSMPEAIEDAIEIQYQSVDVLAESLTKIAENPLFQAGAQITADQLRAVSNDQMIVDLARGLLLLGVRERSSDIHIDPEAERLCVRFRIDGVLQDRMDIEKPLGPPILSYLKILADLDITEKRRPQDGRIKVELANRSIDFRFSTVPTIYGEKVVLRVLGQMSAQDVPDLEELNFTPRNLEKVITGVSRPNGIFFVTGPTGSGKSTTLFSALKHLNSRDVNIMTVEDPVEYQLRGINQIQVNTEVGLDFAKALRAFLRQDPDVILVGEIRDYETAKIASEAALTGHMVLATMHTNNAIQVITRLLEIGVEPYLVAPSIVGALSQRLVRRICDNCKENYRPSDEDMDKYFEWDGRTQVFFSRGKGCDECGKMGYKGRTAIHEAFLMNSDIRALVGRNAPIGEIEKMVYESGFKNIRYDAMIKVLRGHTTVEEIERVTASEEQL